MIIEIDPLDKIATITLTLDEIGELKEYIIKNAIGHGKDRAIATKFLRAYDEVRKEIGNDTE